MLLSANTESLSHAPVRLSVVCAITTALRSVRSLEPPDMGLQTQPVASGEYQNKQTSSENETAIDFFQIGGRLKPLIRLMVLVLVSNLSSLNRGPWRCRRCFVLPSLLFKHIQRALDLISIH